MYVCIYIYINSIYFPTGGYENPRGTSISPILAKELTEILSKTPDLAGRDRHLWDDMGVTLW